MKTDLTDTTASKINKALVQGRRAIGTPAVGMVLTLVIVTDEENAYDSLKAANDASREHPSRTLVVVKRVSRSPRDRTQSRLDAEVRLGADAGSGETVVLRLYGEVVDHAQSVVLPLLLPDAPVVVWWPVNAPLHPAKDPLGALGQRRVTDTYAAEQPVRELTARAETYTPGDTDLSWTRITPWRSMLAAALDQVNCRVESVEVEGEEFNPSCELLAMWLADRLDVPVKRTLSGGPGLTAVRMSTDCGPVVLDRADGSLATLSIQGQPDRAVALKRRDTAELIAEELRRLDPDDTYASALRYGVDRLNATSDAAEAFAADGDDTVGDGDGEAAAEPEAPEAVAKGADGAGSADAAGGNDGDGKREAVETPVEEAAKAPASEAAAPEPVTKGAAK
ncbi:glucose-6-phosphate dehydrogenase assembly protein OpcA [Streptomyces galbus]|uniref:Glucose-6-phosphate dehydrogenase assembly protein OpcA n=1 Tax=Streptomyces galbus TaxID=33898 RepID=A0ABX1IMB9_STRGB|nr:glucose-6-phosphate dehydrogenase assembly protein OpcA [Streptomyces galbus]NKQ26769.1 glucose-6-phosphate dehydrogenase assembly protein OpcA [Streptomyces galbus]